MPYEIEVSYKNINFPCMIIPGNSFQKYMFYGVYYLLNIHTLSIEQEK